MTDLADGQHIQCYNCRGCSPYVIEADGELVCPVCESPDIEATVNRPGTPDAGASDGGSVETVNWVAKSL